MQLSGLSAEGKTRWGRAEALKSRRLEGSSRPCWWCYNPCSLVLIHYLVSWGLGKAKQENKEILSVRRGLLDITGNGGRKKGVQRGALTSSVSDCGGFRQCLCHLFCRELRIEECPPWRKTLSTSSDSIMTFLRHSPVFVHLSWRRNKSCVCKKRTESPRGKQQRCVGCWSIQSRHPQLGTSTFHSSLCKPTLGMCMWKTSLSLKKVSGITQKKEVMPEQERGEHHEVPSVRGQWGHLSRDGEAPEG